MQLVLQFFDAHIDVSRERYAVGIGNSGRAIAILSAIAAKEPAPKRPAKR
ncbi:hypothetical protein [Paenibacillus brevis]|uniref:Uncharacterized protein n=1 Tax=Paenibacillus brevis TaxID=2841508 RepID=A0ABS6FPB0_9BACL|nr:hypothetical protein [Paenibacillus brevis]MBU5670980.1 hypothetical protein [Paenibacillus brevis]